MGKAVRLSEYCFYLISLFNLEVMSTYPKFCYHASNSKVLYAVKVGLKRDKLF